LPGLADWLCSGAEQCSGHQQQLALLPIDAAIAGAAWPSDAWLSTTQNGVFQHHHCYRKETSCACPPCPDGNVLQMMSGKLKKQDSMISQPGFLQSHWLLLERNGC
jgi:hypothetical protein